MSILKNAVDSIAIGLEDFESTDKRRVISSARNIFAGILLLFKHKLSELSPPDSDEVLIKQKVRPERDTSGVIRWSGVGKKTVDVQSIKDRFDSLGITVDWKRLEKVNRYRNDIEHYYSSLDSLSVQQLISDSFIIIRDFIVDELDEDPKQLLGQKYWQILVEVNEVHEKERLECNASLENLNYLSQEILHAIQDYRCQSCGSVLLESLSDSDSARKAQFQCRTCNTEYEYDDIINDALAHYYAGDLYEAHTNGGDIPILDCPFCHDGSYLVYEGVCASCGDSATHVCARCGSSIPPEEITDENMCGYCLHMWHKVMAE